MKTLIQHSFLVIVTVWLLQFASLYFNGRGDLEIPDEDQDKICMTDKVNYTYICRPKCEQGYFSLPGMNRCRPWLTCPDMKKELRILEPMAHGAVKMVYKAMIDGKTVVYSVLRKMDYQEDFRHGLEMLQALQPSHHVTQLLGHCGDSFVTEYHPLGTALSVNALLDGPASFLNNINTRFELCINYVEIIHFLHNSPIGIRVMCDSNDVEKTLSQFLVNPDLTLVANDLDALPEVQGQEGIKCGHRQLYGDFVAPEQLWPFENSAFVDNLMPGYDEKTDIWKIPDVCNNFLGHINEASLLQFHLYKIHKQCKDRHPIGRPSAQEILDAYHEVKSTLGL